MVSVLNTITLNCPAEECNEKFLYSQFLIHKKTCVFLNMKTCDQCKVKMELPEYERHVACFEILFKSYDELKMTNEALKKASEEEKKKYQATKTHYTGLIAKHTKTLAENKAYASKVNQLTVSLEKSNNQIKQLQAAYNDSDQKALKDLQVKYQKTLAENRVNASSVNSLTVSLNRSNEMIRQLQLANDDKVTQLHQLQYHNHAGGAQNHFLAAENEKLKKSVKDLNTKITKLQREHHTASYNLKEENRMLKNAANEKAAIQKKNDDLMNTQPNRIKNLEAEAKNLRKSIEQHKKNAAETKKKSDEMLKKSKTTSDSEILALKNEMAELRSNYDHLSDLFCQGEDTENCKTCKSGVIQSLLPKTLPVDKEKVLNDKIKNLTSTVALQRENHKNAKKELEKRVKKSFESKIADLERALQNNVEQSKESFEKISNEKNALLAEVLGLRQQREIEKIKLCDEQQHKEKMLAEANIKMEDMKKQIDEKNDQIAEILQDQAVKKTQAHPLSDDHSSEIAKLKNEIARIEQSANLYFQMYEKERKINQV